MLNLDILGSFSARLEDESSPNFRTDKARAMLVYLASHVDQPMSRDLLATQLWSDLEEKAAQANLRKALYHLRKAFGPRAKQALETGDGLIWLNSAEIALDTLTFKQLVKKTETHQHDTLANCPRCISQLQQASTLYRGELLAGFSVQSAYGFEEWVTVEREHYHHIAVNMLQRLTAALLEKGSWSEAQRYAIRQIGLEPWRENAHQQLMLALAEQGQPQAALKQLELCKAILWDELGAEPSSELIALADEIREGRYVPIQKPLVMPPPARRVMHNLPAATTRFFGRTAETQRLSHLLKDRLNRWVTLLGAGGMGKSRLARQVGHSLVEHFEDGVWFVALAGLDGQEIAESEREQQIATTIAATLGVQLMGADSAETQLVNHLRDKHLLLILDNFEHVLEGGGLLNRLLQGAAQLAVLCTSRAALQFRSEYCYRLSGLAVPTAANALDAVQLEQLRQYPSVQLFADGAQRVAEQFELSLRVIGTISHICRWVGGNALGIELAASWLRHKSLDEIWSDLQGSYTTLRARMRDVPTRHRSMQAVFEQSWVLLTAAEQATLARLSVFRGGFDSAAADAVVGADEIGLFDLVEQSLLQHEDGRFAMHEALRQFSAEMLTTTAQTAQAHSRYFLNFLHDREEALQRDAPQIPAAEIDREFDNIRSAWDSAIAYQQGDLLSKGLTAFSNYYQMRGRALEAWTRFADLSNLLRQESVVNNADGFALSLIEVGRFLNRLGRTDEAMEILTEARDLADSTSNTWAQGMANVIFAESHWRIARHQEAQDILHAIAKDALTQNPSVQAWRYHHLGITSDLQGEPEQAAQYLGYADQIWQKVGDGRRRLNTLHSIAVVESNRHNHSAALSALNRALLLTDSLDDNFMRPNILFTLGKLHLEQSHYEEAGYFLNQALILSQQYSRMLLTADAYFLLARLNFEVNKPVDAQLFARQAVEMYSEFKVAKGLEDVRLLEALHRGQENAGI